MKVFVPLNEEKKKIVDYFVEKIGTNLNKNEIINGSLDETVSNYICQIGLAFHHKIENLDSIFFASSGRLFTPEEVKYMRLAAQHECDLTKFVSLNSPDSDKLQSAYNLFFIADREHNIEEFAALPNEKLIIVAEGIKDGLSDKEIESFINFPVNIATKTEELMSRGLIGADELPISQFLSDEENEKILDNVLEEAQKILDNITKETKNSIVAQPENPFDDIFSLE